MDSLYAQALAQRQDLQQAEYQIEANKSSYRASINGYMPRVSLFAQYGSYYNSSMRDQPLYGEFSNQFVDVWPSTVYGVSVSIPIFDQFQTRRMRVTNRMEYENSKLQRDNIEKSIKIDVKRSYNNYLTAKQAYDASQTQFQAGELALKTQQESFLLGVSNQVTLAQANQTYVQAASSRAQARVTLVFQKILLEYALGTLKPEEVQ
jgi:outer membrane protein TolC